MEPRSDLTNHAFFLSQIIAVVRLEVLLVPDISRRTGSKHNIRTERIIPLSASVALGLWASVALRQSTPVALD